MLKFKPCLWRGCQINASIFLQQFRHWIYFCFSGKMADNNTETCWLWRIINAQKVSHSPNIKNVLKRSESCSRPQGPILTRFRWLTTDRAGRDGDGDMACCAVCLYLVAMIAIVGSIMSLGVGIQIRCVKYQGMPKCSWFHWYCSPR